MEFRSGRIILVDTCDATREVLATRLRAQGYVVETASDGATGAHLALSAPPAAVIADLWMPSISGVQLCMLLRSEPATAQVPVILRGELDDPRSRFWAERAGAAFYVAKGRMGDLLRALQRAAVNTAEDAFFFQLSGGDVDIRDRIARQLDAALFDSAIAGEVRALASCESFERLFDRLSQFVSQIMRYRWLAVSTSAPERFAIHHHPAGREESELEARAALELAPSAANAPIVRVEDEDATREFESEGALVQDIAFGNMQVGRVALCGPGGADGDTASVLSLIARELGGPIRMAMLVEESQRMATTDSLTGLMNRRALCSAMQIELARCHRHGFPLALALMDVDHFKVINDRRGHVAGDQVLASLGGLLRGAVRREDIAARWGGEEFVVALTNSRKDGGMAAGERLRRAVEEVIILDGGGERIPVTASVGIAVIHPGESLESLVDRADRAMYASKTSGRNRVTLAADDVDAALEVA